MRAGLEDVQFALSGDNIETDNSAQYVIYTGVRAPHKYVSEIWEDSEYCDECDEDKDHSSHKEH